MQTAFATPCVCGHGLLWGKRCSLLTPDVPFPGSCDIWPFPTYRERYSGAANGAWVLPYQVLHRYLAQTLASDTFPRYPNNPLTGCLCGPHTRKCDSTFRVTDCESLGLGFHHGSRTTTCSALHASFGLFDKCVPEEIWGRWNCGNANVTLALCPGKGFSAKADSEG